MSPPLEGAALPVPGGSVRLHTYPSAAGRGKPPSFKGKHGVTPPFKRTDLGHLHEKGDIKE